MAYTLEQLTQAYTAVHDGIPPDATTRATLQTYLNLVASGAQTDAQALGFVINSADNSTALAVLAYQFFTGKSPTKAGLDYLVNSSANTNDLNDAYYAKFNIENRYINFAANLGVQGEGAANFATKYGAMSYADFVASIYETIIGGSFAKAAGVDAAKAVADIASRQGAILATAQASGMITPGMTAAQIDLAVKAATAGYLLGEAIKADVGIYAGAANGFMLALATGNPVYGTDITKTYAPTPGPAGQPVTGTPVLPGGPPASTFVQLTATIHTIRGGDGNDTFNGDNLTVTAGDVIDGGDGADTLNLTANIGGIYTVPTITVTNVETVNVSNSDRATVNATSWTGLNRINISGSGATVLAPTTTDITANLTTGLSTILGGHDVTLNVSNGGDDTVGVSGATGAVVVNYAIPAGGNTGGFMTVRGGTSVNITQTATNAVNTIAKTAPIFVGGSALTTAVTIKAPQAATADATHAGVTLDTVTIEDVNAGSTTALGKITSINVDGYTTLTIKDTALSTLKVGHGSGNISIDNSGLTTPVVRTLNMSVNGLTGGTLSDSSIYTTLNITTGAEASTMGLNMGALTALNVGGTGSLSLNAINATNPLQTITVTGAASFDAFPMSGVTALTTLNASATSGVITGNIDPSRTTASTGSGADTLLLTSSTVSKAISLGAGNDMLILASGTTALGATLDGGAGTADQLVMRAVDAATASGSAAFGSHLTGFEQLQITAAVAQTIDVGALGFNYVNVSVGGGNGLTLNGMSSGGTLKLTGAGVAYTLGSGNFGGANDVLNLILADGSGAARDFATTGITTAGVETFNITTDDLRTTPTGTFLDAVTLLSSDAKTITISGDAGLTLTATSTALTTLDASGITKGDFTWTAANLSSGIAVKGSATGTNTITFGNTSGANTYQGGSGDDVVSTSTSGATNVVHLGAGNNYFSGYVATLTAGAGDDYVSLVGGTASLNLGDGNNVFLTSSYFSGNLVTGAGNDQIFVNGGASVVNVGSGFDRVDISGVDSNSANSFHALIGMGAGDQLSFTGLSNATAATIGAKTVGQTTFAGYLNAAAQDVAGGTNTMHWFEWSGDVFIVADLSNSTSFDNGTDVLVRLVGAAGQLNVGLAGVAAGTITFH